MPSMRPASLSRGYVSNLDVRKLSNQALRFKNIRVLQLEVQIELERAHKLAFGLAFVFFGQIGNAVIG